MTAPRTFYHLEDGVWMRVGPVPIRLDVETQDEILADLHALSTAHRKAGNQAERLEAMRRAFELTNARAHASRWGQPKPENQRRAA